VGALCPTEALLCVIRGDLDRWCVAIGARVLRRSGFVIRMLLVR